MDTDSPQLSIVLIVYNMSREAPRTLYTLSSSYQRGVCAEQYEILVVDNGSDAEIDPRVLSGLDGNFRYMRNQSADRSLAGAVNFGASQSRAEFLGVAVDGARMSTPGTLKLALQCLHQYAMPVVGTVGFHLGHDIQQRAVLRGYNQGEEDQLLNSVDWKADGYRLFDIAVPGDSSRMAWFGPVYESNLFFMRREHFFAIDGFDQRFDLPGGGLVNLDFWKRAGQAPCDQMLVLLGEATFHQFHGGITTNQPAYVSDFEIQKYLRQYLAIKGEEYRTPEQPLRLYGDPHPSMARHMANAAHLIQSEHAQTHRQAR